MNFPELNKEQKDRTFVHFYLAHQLKKSKNEETSHPKEEDNNNITLTNTLMAGHQNSPTAMSPHMKMNDSRSDKMPPIKTQDRGVTPCTRMIAEFKSDTNNVSNKTNLTAPEANLKLPFPVTPQKGLIEKNSTVKVTPEKPRKSVEERNCVPSSKSSERPKENSTKTSKKSNLSPNSLQLQMH